MNRRALAIWLAASGLAVAIGCAQGGDPPASDKKVAAKSAVTAADIEKGRGMYMTTCAPCHGNGGKGDGPAAGIFKPAPRDHTDAAYMSTIDDEMMGKIIQMGGGVRNKPNMPSNPQIRGNDLAALVAYVRTLSRPAQ